MKSAAGAWVTVRRSNIILTATLGPLLSSSGEPDLGARRLWCWWHNRHASRCPPLRQWLQSTGTIANEHPVREYEEARDGGVRCAMICGHHHPPKHHRKRW